MASGWQVQGSPSARSARTNPYERPCGLCSGRGTCAACVQTAQCTECTRTARCGSCRNIHSKLARAAGRASMGSPRRSTLASSPLQLGQAAAPPDALDLPRSREGLHTFYELVATTTDALRFSGGRGPRGGASHATVPAVPSQNATYCTFSVRIKFTCAR